MFWSRDSDDSDRDDAHSRDEKSRFVDAPGATENSKRVGPSALDIARQSAIAGTENGPEPPTEPDTAPCQTDRYAALSDQNEDAVILDTEIDGKKAWVSAREFINVGDRL